MEASSDASRSGSFFQRCHNGARELRHKAADKFVEGVDKVTLRLLDTDITDPARREEADRIRREIAERTAQRGGAHGRTVTNTPLPSTSVPPSAYPASHSVSASSPSPNPSSYTAQPLSSFSKSSHSPGPSSKPPKATVSSAPSHGTYCHPQSHSSSSSHKPSTQPSSSHGHYPQPTHSKSYNTPGSSAVKLPVSVHTYPTHPVSPINFSFAEAYRNPEVEVARTKYVDYMTVHTAEGADAAHMVLMEAGEAARAKGNAPLTTFFLICLADHHAHIGCINGYFQPLERAAGYYTHAAKILEEVAEKGYVEYFQRCAENSRLLSLGIRQGQKFICDIPPHVRGLIRVDESLYRGYGIRS